MMKKKKIIVILSVLMPVLIAVSLIAIFFEDINKFISTSGEVSDWAYSSVDSETTQDSSASAESQQEESSSPESSEESSSEIPEPQKIPLEVTAPKADITVYYDTVTIKGSADVTMPVYINGEEITLSSEGYFSEKKTLQVGNNYFTVKQAEEEYKCVVRYRKTVILDTKPDGKLTLDGGSALTVTAKALANSKVTATFNGKTVALTEKKIEKQEEYSDYYGKFTMPVNYEKNVNYGKVTFAAESYAGKGKAEGAEITVKKTNPPVTDNYVMPKGENYIDVGHTYVAEVVCRSAEAMNVDDTVDYSRPDNNYLPKGTVDYCSGTVNKLFIGGDEVEFRTLRYGKQHYVKTEAGNNIKVYQGKLPDVNKLSVAEFSSGTRHTSLTLNVAWKAPFTLELAPQKYNNDGKSKLDYSFSEATYKYVDITFCYAAELKGKINLEGNKIFSSYEIIKNQSDYTLRLHLKKAGGFYGWSAEYNEKGQLVFKFLNPLKLQKAENKYGFSLKGAVIVLDAGHGGDSVGAVGFSSENSEKVLNLKLAERVEKRLKELGATVYMTRSTDASVSAEQRMNLVRDKKPDYVLSIHRNASTNTNASAFISYHFTPYSASAAKSIYSETAKKNLYKETRWSGTQWHYFFLCRTTEAPSVLTENGFITNAAEYKNITDNGFNDKCADALVDGIFAYFKQIQ